MPVINNLLVPAILQTVYMIALSSFVACLFGIPLGFVLFTTRPNGIIANEPLNKVLSVVVNALRSVPFIILMVAIIPFTRFVVGTTIGTTAAIVPLIIAAIPFVGRVVENALEDVPAGLTEAAIAIGASPFQIMHKVLLAEALPGIVNGITLTVIAITGYSAMAGAVGGGGLGDLGIRYGYQRFDLLIMIVTVALLIVLVQLIQTVGDKISRRLNKRA